MRISDWSSDVCSSDLHLRSGLNRVMLPVADARARIVAALPVMPAETVDLRHAAGRVLAEDVAARRTQPPFDASAMDGWACRQADLGTLPARLKPVGAAAAGGRHAGTVGPGDRSEEHTSELQPLM